jgi:FHA domain-containing protein
VVRPSGDALALAFLEGAGIANFNLPAGLTPQTMNMLGQVLRQTVQTILDLLLARAMLKREMRADVTMIVAQENNPLKFSPNVEAALMHLLVPQRGYMQPLDAVKDACDDLRSNQFAFMAGMRAALAGILQRFNPDQLEQRLKHKSMLDSLLPANRKAKMWDLFSDLYGDVSREAEDNFHEIFGREFVRAYEAQIAKLSRQDGGGRS